MEPDPGTAPIRRDERLKAAITERLASFTVRPHTEPAARRAAVAVAVIDEGHGADLEGLPHHTTPSDRAALLLTRRSKDLRNHAGQWALPGGRIESGESPEDAALRELAEEVGLVVDRSSVLGRLDDFATRSGFVITPIIVWPGPALTLSADAGEVQSIHRIPLEEFLRADAPLLETLPDHAQPVLRMPVGRGWIAAPTAAVIYQFRELCLLGRPTRVAHFEQPLFAWR